jgi:hypothetical protein
VAVKVYDVPTALGMNASGSTAANRCWAFQPVQWAGTRTSGASTANAATVGSMIGSKAGL